LAALRLSAEEKDQRIADLNFLCLSIQRTIGWKALERLRRVRDRLVPPNTRRWTAYWTVRRMVEVLLDESPQAFLRKTSHKIRQALRGQRILARGPSADMPQHPNAQYQVWLQQHRLTPQEIARMKAAAKTFSYTPLISIVTPVYDTDEVWLRKAIESVRAQIYPHWELCLVNDASTKPHVGPILEESVAGDSRVRVKHLPYNEGIVGASTHALSLATGEFIGLLDHDDELSPDALFEVVKRLNEDPNLDLLYSDEDKLELDGLRVEPFFKPDWSPDLLLSMNYISHFSVLRRSILTDIGGFRAGFDGRQDYDLLLRFTELTDKIAHIPKILYHWRKTPGSAAASTAAKPFAYEAAQRAIEDALRRRGYEGRVERIVPGLFAVRYRIPSAPLVSIIIPTRDRWQLLQQCVRSIEKKTDYARYEIIVLDNDSIELETLNYLDAIASKWGVYRCPGPFNFSTINNFGASKAKGDYLLFLNNDTQVIRSDWLTAMVEQAQRPEVGAVGAKLLYPDGRIQHAGVILGIGGVAVHAFKYRPANSTSQYSFADVVRNCSAVTAACMLVRQRIFWEVGGFDERLRVAFNDVDLCLRLRQQGYLIVYTPFALLYHYESATRGRLHPPEDEELAWKLWGDLIRRGDAYYNPNLTVSREDWSLRL
jgi:GT2 family glycosyltransferase